MLRFFGFRSVVFGVVLALVASVLAFAAPTVDAQAGPLPVPECSFAVDDGAPVGGDAGGVDVSWTPVDGVDRYVIRRTVNGGAEFWRGAVVGAESSSFRDLLPNAGPNAVFTYTVETKSGSVFSAATDCVNTGPEPAGPPTVPECSFLVDAAGVDVSWTPVDGVDRYVIRRTVNGNGPFHTGAVDGAASSSFRDDLPNVGASAVMTYTVEAKTGGAFGPATTCVNSGSEPAGPPTVPACSFVVDSSGVDVTWTAVSGADKYVIRRAVNGGEVFWTGAVDGADASSFRDDLPTAGANAVMTYTVEAQTGGVNGLGTACVNGGSEPAGPPTVPECAFAVDGTGVDVTWTAVDGADKYVIRRSVNGGEVFWTGAVTGTTSSTFRDDLPTAGADAEMIYSVQAQTGGNNGPLTECGDGLDRFLSTLTGTPDNRGSTNGSLADAGFNSPYDIKASYDGDTLYVSDTGNNKIRTIDLTTGVVSDFATITNPYNIDVDIDGTVYVIAKNTGVNADGRITGSLFKISPDGGLITTIRDNLLGPSAVAVGNGNVYLTLNELRDISGSYFRVALYNWREGTLNYVKEVGIGKWVSDMAYDRQTNKLWIGVSDRVFLSTDRVSGSLGRFRGEFIAFGEYGEHIYTSTDAATFRENSVPPTGPPPSCDDAPIDAIVRQNLVDPKTVTSLAIDRTTQFADGIYDQSSICGVGGITVVEDTLYIADTGNHAIRKIGIPKEEPPSYQEQVQRCQENGGGYFFVEPVLVDGQLYVGCVVDDGCVSTLPSKLGDLAAWSCENQDFLKAALVVGAVVVVGLAVAPIIVAGLPAGVAAGSAGFVLPKAALGAGLFAAGGIAVINTFIVQTQNGDLPIAEVIDFERLEEVLLGDVPKLEDEVAEQIEEAGVLERLITERINDELFGEDVEPPSSLTPSEAARARRLVRATTACLALGAGQFVSENVVQQLVERAFGNGATYIFDAVSGLVEDIPGQEQARHLCELVSIYLPGGLNGSTGTPILAATLHISDVLYGRRDGVSDDGKIRWGEGRDWDQAPQTPYGNGRPDWSLVSRRAPGMERNRNWLAPCSIASSSQVVDPLPHPVTGALPDLVAQCDEYPLAILNTLDVIEAGPGPHLRHILRTENSSAGNDLANRMWSSTDSCGVDIGEYFFVIPQTLTAVFADAVNGPDNVTAQEVRTALEALPSDKLCS